MRKTKVGLKIIIVLIIVLAAVFGFIYLKKNYCYIEKNQVKYNIPGKFIKNILEKISYKIDFVEVEKIVVDSDKDGDGILDLDDIVEGARKDVANKPKYKSAYYDGGYPPDNEGVCTDVIWRAFKNTGYNLKDMVDKDIKDCTDDYPRVEGKPDPNIDFRRVRNLHVFFEKYAQKLTNELKPKDPKNLKEWQGGDIVIFKHPKEHVVVVSDRRALDGVPFIIHNSGPYTKEWNDLQYWMNEIIGHYRFPKVTEGELRSEL
jgi:uncharacterized protein YijF (DUF1287 family)